MACTAPRPNGANKIITGSYQGMLRMCPQISHYHTLLSLQDFHCFQSFGLEVLSQTKGVQDRGSHPWKQHGGLHLQPTFVAFLSSCDHGSFWDPSCKSEPTVRASPGSHLANWSWQICAGKSWSPNKGRAGTGSNFSSLKRWGTEFPLDLKFGGGPQKNIAVIGCNAYKSLKNSQDSFDEIWGREICMALLHPMKLSIYMVLGVPNFYGWLVIRMEIWHLPAWPVHQRSGLRSHQGLRWITIPWLQPMNTDSPGQHPKYSCDFWDSNRRFDGIGMCTVGQHLTCAMVALAQSLAGNSLSSVNLLRCIPKGRYKWKPFLELLSQVVCENVTTFASSGSTWNSMVFFCCVLSMYHHVSIWLFIMIRFIYLYCTLAHQLNEQNKYDVQ